jgi:hypothetical protein
MRGISWLAAKFTVSFSRRTLLHGVSKYSLHRPSISHNSNINSSPFRPSVVMAVLLRVYKSKGVQKSQRISLYTLYTAHMRYGYKITRLPAQLLTFSVDHKSKYIMLYLWYPTPLLRQTTLHCFEVVSENISFITTLNKPNSHPQFFLILQVPFTRELRSSGLLRSV